MQERSAKENQNPGWFFKYFGIKNENKIVKNSQLSNDQTVTLAENNSKAIFIRCIANICKGSVKNTIKRDVSISATVIFKHEIKATAVIIFIWHLVFSVTVCPGLRWRWWIISKTPDCLLFNNNVRSSR